MTLNIRKSPSMAEVCVQVLGGIRRMLFSLLAIRRKHSSRRTTAIDPFKKLTGLAEGEEALVVGSRSNEEVVVTDNSHETKIGKRTQCDLLEAEEGTQPSKNSTGNSGLTSHLTEICILVTSCTTSVKELKSFKIEGTTADSTRTKMSSKLESSTSR